uniref:DnaJ homolog subfamily B member 9 n=1 Tax=Cyclopterus lumpus TaxID=8103 RepID=A0A8C2XCR3_CYCLU
MAVQGVSHRMPAYVVILLCLAEVLPAASESDRTYYETLDVERSATGSHIKKVFRQLAIKYHPDKNKSAGAEKSFREIVEGNTVDLFIVLHGALRQGEEEAV